MINNFRDAVTRRLGALLSSPQVAALMRDERVMRALMSVLQASQQVRSARNELLRRVARRLRLATEDDLRDLRKSLRKLESTIAEDVPRAATPASGDGHNDGRSRSRSTPA